MAVSLLCQGRDSPSLTDICMHLTPIHIHKMLYFVIHISLCFTRMFFVASREGQLPQVLSMIHVKRHTPLAAVFVLVSLLLLFHDRNSAY